MVIEQLTLNNERIPAPPTALPPPPSSSAGRDRFDIGRGVLGGQWLRAMGTARRRVIRYRSSTIARLKLDIVRIDEAFCNDGVAARVAKGLEAPVHAISNEVPLKPLVAVFAKCPVRPHVAANVALKPRPRSEATRVLQAVRLQPSARSAG